MPTSGNVVLNNNSNDRQEILSIHSSCWSLSKSLPLLVWLENFKTHLFEQSSLCAGQTRHLTQKKISQLHNVHIIITGLQGLCEIQINVQGLSE